MARVPTALIGVTLNWRRAAIWSLSNGTCMMPANSRSPFGWRRRASESLGNDLGPRHSATLADFRDYTTWIDGRNCRRSGKLNIVELGMRYGCGSSDHAVTISHEGQPTAPGSDLAELP